MRRVTVKEQLQSIKSELLWVKEFIDQPYIYIMHIGSTGDCIIRNKCIVGLPSGDFDASTVNKKCGSGLCGIDNAINRIDNLLNNVKIMIT